MTAHAFLVNSKTAYRNQAGQLVISFSDIVFFGDPVVFVTPYWQNSGQAVQDISTIVNVDKATVTIIDDFIHEDYFLQVLLVDPELPNMVDRYSVVSTTLKNKAGIFQIPELIGDVRVPDISFLAPYWKGSQSKVGHIETVFIENQGSQKIFTYSGNAADNYYVNMLNVQQYISTLSVGDKSDAPKIFNAGSAVKTKVGPLTIDFEQPYESPPLVFLTPYWDLLPPTVSDPIVGNEVGSIETVQNITQTSFDVISNNANPRYFVNWLAVPQGTPRLTMSDVNGAFEHFYGHFPEHKDDIETHRADFEKIILEGADPTQAMKNKIFDNKPEFAKSKREVLTPMESAVASFCLDSISLVLDLIGIEIKAKSLKVEEVLQNIGGKIKKLEDFPVKSNIMDKMTDLIQAYNRAAKGLDKTKSLAMGIAAISVDMFTTGIIKTILVAAAHAMTWYEWVIAGLSAAAHFTALVVTGPAALLGWAARILAMITDSAKLTLDIVKLVTLTFGTQETV